MESEYVEIAFDKVGKYTLVYKSCETISEFIINSICRYIEYITYDLIRYIPYDIYSMSLCIYFIQIMEKHR